MLLSDIDQLPDPERRAVAQADRDVLNTWVGVLQAAAPEPATAEAKMPARSTTGVVDDLVRTPGARRRPDLADRLSELGAAILRTR
ncbi:hypothetical protein ACWEFL_07735 [Streptomyces sp. NPDC004838]